MVDGNEETVAVSNSKDRFMRTRAYQISTLYGRGESLIDIDTSEADYWAPSSISPKTHYAFLGIRDGGCALY